MRNKEADNLVSSEGSDGDFLFDKVNKHRGVYKNETKVTLTQMDNTVTVYDVMSSLSNDEKDQDKDELNVVSPHFSSEKNDT